MRTDANTSQRIHLPLVAAIYACGMLIRRLGRSTVVLAAEAGALIALLAVPAPAIEWADLAGWLDRVAPEDAVVALVRFVSIVTAAYLLASTGLYLLAQASRIPALVRGVARFTLPGIRRVVDGALAATIVIAPTSLAFGASPAAAQAAPVSAHAYAPSPAGDTGPIYEPTPAGGEAADAPAATHVVRRGDSLWTIATEHLAATRGVSADAVPQLEVAEVWREIVSLNVSSLSSGDPNLIYPGETIQLPAR